MNATIPVLLVSTVFSALAPRSAAQEPIRPEVGTRRPIDVSVEGLGDATRGAPGDPGRAGRTGGSARRSTGSTLPLDCLESIGDQATGSCLTASSTPVRGLLFPYPGVDNTFVAPAVVAGGEDNTASGPLSTIGGGRSNTASGLRVTVGGGSGNTASADFATIGGGFANHAYAANATVAGGASNDALATGTTISGGFNNEASGTNSTVSGGGGNEAAGSGSTVGGGNSNDASTSLATIGGGYKNRSDGDGATVGGGRRNRTYGAYATVGGGVGNTASGRGATVAGGGGFSGPPLFEYRGNTASGSYAAVGGGAANTASGYRATVPGGYGNTARGNHSFAAGRRAVANHNGAFVWGDTQDVDKTSSGSDQFNVYCRGGARFLSNPTFTTGVLLAPGASTWTMVSDRDAKENVEPVDARTVLAKVAELPVATWNYKDQDDSIRHMGPMAQDFHAAFGLGLGERTIDTIDPNGVALAAIQGLNELVQRSEQRLAEKDAEIVDLRARIERLEALARVASAK